MTNDVFILMQGGGIRAGVVGGMLAALEQWVFSREEYAGLKRHILASSGSAGTAMYWVSHLPMGPRAAIDVSRAIWLDALTDPQFVKFRRMLVGQPIMDIEYLVHHIFMQKHSLYLENIAQSQHGFALPAWSVDQKKVHWLAGGQLPDLGVPTVRLNALEESYAALHAVKAIPYLYNKAVSIGEHMYTDGAGIYPIPLISECAWRHKTILLLTQSRDYNFLYSPSKYLEAMMGYLLQIVQVNKLPWSVYHHCARRGYRFWKLLTEAQRLQAAGRLLIIEPEPEYQAPAVWDNSPSALEYNFAMGERAVEGKLGATIDFLR